MSEKLTKQATKTESLSLRSFLSLHNFTSLWIPGKNEVIKKNSHDD